MYRKYLSTNLYEKTVHTLIGTFCVLSLVYAVVLLSLVFSVIERKQNTIASRDLGSELSALQANYANTVSSINDTVLARDNYTRIGASFAVRKDDIASYTVLYAR